MKNNPGVVLTYNDTNLILIGKRDTLYTEEAIGIHNCFSRYIEVDLKEIGITEKILNHDKFKKNIFRLLAYLNHNKMIDKRVYRDVRIIMSDNHKDKVTAGIEEHKALLHENYDTLPGLTIHPNRDRIILKIPSHNDTIIKIVFMFKGRQYHVITNISEPNGKTVSVTRWKKISSAQSLLNYLQDWSNDNSISSSNRDIVKTYHSDLTDYFLCEKNNESVINLINHINEYSHKGR